MAYQDYYDWVYEAQDLYGLDYHEAQDLWADTREQTGERPTFDMLYDPASYDEPYEEPDELEDFAAEEIADRETFADYDVGAYDELEQVGGFDSDEWWEEFFEAYDEVEVTAIYE